MPCSSHITYTGRRKEQRVTKTLLRFTASRSIAVVNKNRSYLPKLGADLVAALATLDVDDLAGR